MMRLDSFCPVAAGDGDADGDADGIANGDADCDADGDADGVADGDADCDADGVALAGEITLKCTFVPIFNPCSAVITRKQKTVITRKQRSHISLRCNI